MKRLLLICLFLLPAGVFAQGYSPLLFSVPHSWTGIQTFTSGIYVKNGGTTAGFVRLYEDSDNGSNYIDFFGPAALGGNYNLTVPTLTAHDTVAVLGLAQTFTALKTSSIDGNNAATEVGLYTNSNECTTGQTGDTVALTAKFMYTSDSGTSFLAGESGRIEVYKVSDWWNAAGVGDNDSGMKFYVTNNGTPSLWLTVAQDRTALFTTAGASSGLYAGASGVAANAVTIGFTAAGVVTYEGATADNFETTIGAVDPTADRTINYPNQSGTVALWLTTTNNALMQEVVAEEEITLSIVGATSDSTADLLPAGAEILGVTYRITDEITGVGVTGFTIGEATTAARFCGSQTTLTNGATGLCYAHRQGGIASDATGPMQDAAAKIRITVAGAVPTAGKVRVAVFARYMTPPST